MIPPTIDATILDPYTLTITVSRGFRWRLWLAVQFLRVAMWIAGMSVEVERITQDDPGQEPHKPI